MYHYINKDFRGLCKGYANTFTAQRCPNETGYEWGFRNGTIGLKMEMDTWAERGLTVKCINEAGKLNILLFVIRLSFDSGSTKTN